MFETGGFGEMLGTMRTPIFFLVFIGVLLVQIFYKKRKSDREFEERLSQMGPLEKGLAGRGPDGKALSAKQLKEIQELDAMIGGMGNLADDLANQAPN